MDYSTLKVAELKDELKKRSIPITKLSRKQEFIDRLLEDDAEKENGVDEDVVNVDATETSGEAHEVNGAERVQVEENAETTAAQSLPQPEITLAAEAGVETNGAPVEVLEKDEPVPEEKLQSSLQASELKQETPQPDEKKRKRRSTSPAPSAESVSKKLRHSADEVVHFEAADSETKTEKLKIEDLKTEEVKADTTSEEAQAMDRSEAVEPSRHAATSAIYIRELIRPINGASLKTHILSLTGASPSTDPISTFHLDSLRTHAFVNFTSISCATRVRDRLHGQVFPPEPTRKPLWVDYIPTPSLIDFIETETSAPTTRTSESKRWEVMYTGPTGSATAELVDVSARGLPPPIAPSTTSFSAPAAPPTKPTPLGPASTAGPKGPLSSVPLPDLESRFPSTHSQPRIFFAPVPSSTVQARMQSLAEHTSKDWDPRADHARFGGSTAGGGAGRGADQLRRYTFQDGAELVDGGAEFGGGKAFGRERGGGGRGGGGGVPRGGDRYRGEGAGSRGYGSRGEDRGFREPPMPPVGNSRGYGEFGAGLGPGSGRYPSGRGGGGFRDRGGYGGGGGGGYPPDDREWVRDRY